MKVTATLVAGALVVMRMADLVLLFHDMATLQTEGGLVFTLGTSDGDGASQSRSKGNGKDEAHIVSNQRL